MTVVETIEPIPAKSKGTGFSATVAILLATVIEKKNFVRRWNIVMFSILGKYAVRFLLSIDSTLTAATRIMHSWICKRSIDTVESDFLNVDDNFYRLWISRHCRNLFLCLCLWILIDWSQLITQCIEMLHEIVLQINLLLAWNRNFTQDIQRACSLCWTKSAEQVSFDH